VLFVFSKRPVQRLACPHPFSGHHATKAAFIEPEERAKNWERVYVARIIQTFVVTSELGLFVLGVRRNIGIGWVIAIASSRGAIIERHTVDKEILHMDID
jgi:hypothetical protein